MPRSRWLVLLILSMGCGSPPTAPSGDGWPWQTLSVSGDVALEPRTSLARDTVQVTLSFRNRGATGARVEFGVCAFGVQGIGRHGATWDNHPLASVGCAEFGLVVQLAPGESRVIPVYRNAAAHIRELAPADYYWVSIFIRQGGVLQRLAAGGLEL